ncbi:sugar phosphate isomerase/epimerase family protein [Streptomyces sp. NPDC021093]|uniref:sugar phosphate isomerase/epimerase family protein n=1 Tax=Streptomyces sp. NPDC021093 TaxID=3365112 RepID=UPI0037A3E358
MSRPATAAAAVLRSSGRRTPQLALADWRLPVAGAAAVELAARVGADAVQLDLGGPGRADWLDAPGSLAALRERSGATGVELTAVSGNLLNDIGLTAPEDSAQGQLVRTTLLRLLDTAHALGVPLVFVPSFRRSAINNAYDLRRTATVLGRAAQEAADRNLLLASENTLSATDSRDLVEAVGSPSFRLLLDTYNPRAAGVDVVELIRVNAPWICDQVHLKDGLRGAGGSVLLGEGDGRLAETLAALADEQVPVRTLVVETDHREGRTGRPAAASADLESTGLGDPGPMDTNLRNTNLMNTDPLATDIAWNLHADISWDLHKDTDPLAADLGWGRRHAGLLHHSIEGTA